MTSTQETVNINVVEPPWPMLDPAAVHGLAGDIVRLLEPHTEADPVAMLVHLLAEYSSVIGSGSRVKLDGSWNPLLFNVVLVGGTSKGRKGTANKRIKEFFKLGACPSIQKCAHFRGI